MMTLLDEEECPKHTEGERDKQLRQYQQSSSAKLVNNKNRDGCSCYLNNSNYNGADIGIKFTPSILEYLDNIGADHFNARKLLKEHQHQTNTQWLQIHLVTQNIPYI